jgi:hypothetical protein
MNFILQRVHMNPVQSVCTSSMHLQHFIFQISQWTWCLNVLTIIFSNRVLCILIILVMAYTLKNTDPEDCLLEEEILILYCPLHICTWCHCIKIKILPGLWGLTRQHALQVLMYMMLLWYLCNFKRKKFIQCYIETQTYYICWVLHGNVILLFSFWN